MQERPPLGYRRRRKGLFRAVIDRFRRRRHRRSGRRWNRVSGKWR